MGGSPAMKLSFYSLFVVLLGVFALFWWVLMHHSQFHAYKGQHSRITERVKSYFYSNSSFVVPRTADNGPEVVRDANATGGSRGSSRQDTGSDSRSKLELILTDKSLPIGIHSITHSLTDTLNHAPHTY